MNKSIRNLCTALTMAVCMASQAFASLTGAIYTSYGDGTTPNGNIYDDCEEVFLNGGPQNQSSSGLPDGVYLFKVTNPNATVLLSTDESKYRQVQVVNGRIFGIPSGLPGEYAPLFGVAAGDPLLHLNGLLNPDNGSIPVQLWHFDETPNNGNEYKVTLYRVIDTDGVTVISYPDPQNPLEIIGDPDDNKTDNFKCLHLEEHFVQISGYKYHDTNGNGVHDQGEVWTGPSVTIQITYDSPEGDPVVAQTQTDETGFWSYILPEGSSFVACEIEPSGYDQTGPLQGATVTGAIADADMCWTSDGANADVTGLDFGNVEADEPPGPATALISGYKYADANGDGVHDLGETWTTLDGYSAVTIEVTFTPPASTPITVQTQTNADGFWSLVVPGGATFEACEVVPTGYSQTGPLDGATSGVATADADKCWTGTVGTSEVAGENDVTGLDFGNALLAYIGGIKYYDDNVNGTYDAVGGFEAWNDDSGFPHVTIEITYTPPGGVETTGSTETSSDGSWSFILPQGSVFEACEVVPAGYTQTGPLEGDTNTAGTATADADMCWTGTVPNGLTHDVIDVAELDFGNVLFTSFAGMKYYDLNLNGIKDAGEVGVAGYKIHLVITHADGSVSEVTVVTDANGLWTYDMVPVGSSVVVSEILALDHWLQLGPLDGATSDYATALNGSWFADPAADPLENLDFGNICLGAGGGHTLGFWSNKNGEATIKTVIGGGSITTGLAVLNNMNLVNANGTYRGVPAFSSYKVFRTWLLNATATNMSYMLSAQLAAMKLNVASGMVDADSVVYAPGCGNTGVGDDFITIGDLIAASVAALGADGLTLSGDATRAYQECLKTALDKANNNKNFVQPEPCPVEYPL